MVYYKLIREGSIFAVGTSEDLRRHQTKHNVLVRCPEGDANYIQVGDLLYHDKWMQPKPTNFFDCEEVEIKAIHEDEYIVLASALKDADEISAEVETPEEPTNESYDEPEETAVGETTVEYIREVKLKELSLACNKAIINGFDLETSDGKKHHFSMTMQDQANLVALQVQLLSGATEIPYHADGEECTLYSADEMAEIINAANAHKTYHLVYFNALKCWINTLKRMSSISSVEYGSEIPKKYRTALLKKYQEER